MIVAKTKLVKLGSTSVITSIIEENKEFQVTICVKNKTICSSFTKEHLADLWVTKQVHKLLNMENFYD